jgi:hypothetical protein
MMISRPIVVLGAVVLSLFAVGCGGPSGGSSDGGGTGGAGGGIAAPSNLSYSTNPASYVRGVAITPNVPSVSGGQVATYAVSPALPAGLSLSASSGVITGTPTALAAPAMYTIAAMNAAGSTSASLSLRVDDPPSVTSVSPTALCAGGGSLSLTVQGSSFLPGAVVTLSTAGQATLTSSSATVNGSGTQLNAVFAGGVTPGATYDVIVDDGNGATDPTPHRTVAGVAGPLPFMVDAPIAYNGISTRIDVYATISSPVGQLALVPAGTTAPVTTLTFDTVAGHPNRLQATVPAGQAAGAYDLLLQDANSCPSLLPNALTVTSNLTIALLSVNPPFAGVGAETVVTVFRNRLAPAPAVSPFVATPAVFLDPTNPSATDVAIRLPTVSLVDGDTLTVAVPKNLPARLYDLVVVNPDGTAGTLPAALTVQAAAPPSISTVTPSSIVDTGGQTVIVSGQGFSGSIISASCFDALGNPLAAPTVVSGAVTCTAAGCSQSATINGGALAVGSMCLLRLTNAGGSYSDYSALGVTSPSLNLPGTRAGTVLNVGRRALVAAVANVNPSARFAYAIGGDPGAAMAATPLASTEIAPVDALGKLGAWTLQPSSSLIVARSFAASARIGRYIYVAGGSDGTTALTSVERAMILSPDEVPDAALDDLVPAATGVDPGTWIYRVSASMAASDLDNAGGETLPSREVLVRVPAIAGKKVQVVLKWSAPADTMGTPLPNLSGYVIYRTPAANDPSGGEVMLATVGAGASSFTDDGSATPGTQAPLPLGATGRWQALPAMMTPRKGAAGAAGPDPSTPGRFYFYALLGLNASNTALTGYEYLPVTVASNGHQTVGSWTPGASSVAQGRWQLGAFVADSTVSGTIPAGQTYVYLGGGLDAALASANAVDAGLIGAGGDLGSLAATPKDFSAGAAGYGVCAANGQLFAFGGAGAAPSSGARVAALVAPPPALANNSWNAEGITLTTGRYLMGSAVTGPFVFLLGGQTNLSAAGKDTEVVLW